MILKLLDLGASIDRRDSIGRTPLMIAVDYGYDHLLDTLLKNGAKFDGMNIFFILPLFFPLCLPMSGAAEPIWVHWESNRGLAQPDKSLTHTVGPRFNGTLGGKGFVR